MYKKSLFLLFMLLITIVFAIYLADEETIYSENGVISKQDISLVSEITNGQFKYSGKVKLSDGDSLKFNSNQKPVRLFAIDSPELAQTCQRNGEKWKCGLQAKNALKKLINGQNITCVGNEKDNYKRLIATCYLRWRALDAEGYINLNAWMVANGWAIAYTYYSDLYVRQEAYAKKQNLGIWRSKFLEPFKWRQLNKRN